MAFRPLIVRILLGLGLTSSIGVLGCARAKVTRLPEGAVRITCEKGMKTCVTRADKLCEDKGYLILGGQSRTHLLGGASSSYRQLRELGEIEIICGDKPPDDQKKPLFTLGKRADAAPGSEGDPAGSSQAEDQMACVPGSTQKCVGPGACEGGQVCLPDGSAFGVCDCGAPTASPLPPAPAKAPPPQEPKREPGDSDPPPRGPETPGAMPEPTPLGAPAGGS